MRQTNIDHQTTIYNNTSFFSGFAASLISCDYVANATRVLFAEGERVLVTDSSEPDNWSVVAINTPVRYGLVHRKRLMVENVHNEPWFFAELPSVVATAVLKRQGPGSFLLRTQKKQFLLSHMSDQTVYHTWIHQSGSGRFYVNSRRRFSTVQELIDYCRRNHVNGMQLEKFPTKKCIDDIWRIDLSSEFRPQKELGGQFPWAVKLGQLKKYDDVAVYALKKSYLSEDEIWIRKQADLLMCLDHVNLVKLLGIGDYDGRYSMALQLDSSVSLSSYISERGSCLLDKSSVLLTIARDICAGMTYLDKRGIVHNELIADNCWIRSDDTHVRIGGFHVARFEEDARHFTPRYRSRVPIYAPELEQGQTGNSKSDVWAYGLLLWHIFTAGRFLEGKKALKLEKVLNRVWVSLPNDVADVIDQMMVACLYQVPQIRPTFDENLCQIKNILSQVITEVLDISEPIIRVDPALFGLETYELPQLADDVDVSQSNTYFGHDMNERHTTYEESDFQFYELDDDRTSIPEIPYTKVDDESSWSSDKHFDTGSPEFTDVLRTSVKRQLTFEESKLLQTPKTPDLTNYVSSDSGCSLTQSRLRRIRSVGDEYQNLRTLCRTYREMFENSRRENDTLTRRLHELEKRNPISDLEKRLTDVQQKLHVTQRECKRLHDRNKMLERSFCRQCRSDLSKSAESQFVANVKEINKLDVVNNTNTKMILSSQGRSFNILPNETSGTLQRAMTQFEMENFQRRERLKSLKSGDTPVKVPGVDGRIELVGDKHVRIGSVREQMLSTDLDHDNLYENISSNISDRTLSNSSQNKSFAGLHSPDFSCRPVTNTSANSPTKLGSFRRSTDISAPKRDSSRRSEYPRLPKEAEIRAAQKLIRDNLQHNYLSSHSHISTIADDGASKVTLF